MERLPYVLHTPLKGLADMLGKLRPSVIKPEFGGVNLVKSLNSQSAEIVSLDDYRKSHKKQVKALTSFTVSDIEEMEPLELTMLRIKFPELWDITEDGVNAMRDHEDFLRGQSVTKKTKFGELTWRRDEDFLSDDEPPAA